MTKMIKMSLIAAVAVTGMTSTVCAQPLEDAIKGVDVSGQLRYRYDNKQSNLTGGAATTSNEYTLKVATKSKVNDIVTANVQVEATGVNVAGYESTHATTDAVGDRDVNLAVTKANFAANLGVATVVAGKQSVPSPFVDNSVDDSTRGTGAVALIPVAGMTVAAGHFVNYSHVAETGYSSTNAGVANSGKSISAVALIGSVANVSFDAWYVDVQDTAKASSFSAKTTIAGVTLDAMTSSVDRAGADNTSKLNKLVASGKVGPVSIAAGIVTTDKKNSTTNQISLDNDNDAKSDFKLYQASVGSLSDATAYYAGLGMDIMPNVKAELKYVTVDFGTGSQSAAEQYAGLTYAMSKNFSVHTRYSNYVVKDTAGVKTTDSDRGRLEIKYTF